MSSESRIIPYLIVNDAARALDFYKAALGAEETLRIDDPAGRVGHAEVRIGGALLMLADEHPEMGIVSPSTLKGTPVMLHCYVPDVDTTAARAVQAGATLTVPPKDEFYGERIARITDPFGHSWVLATKIEEVSSEEMVRRAKALYGG